MGLRKMYGTDKPENYVGGREGDRSLLGSFIRRRHAGGGKKMGNFLKFFGTRRKLRWPTWLWAAFRDRRNGLNMQPYKIAV